MRDPVHGARRTQGEQLADTIVSHVGSWPFIMIQTGIMGLWILLNSVAWLYHWDVYPFILLNLLLSTQAAFTGPLVLLSQNRQAVRDHERDALEAAEIQVIYEGNDLLMQINREQLEILRILHTHLVEPREEPGAS